MFVVVDTHLPRFEALAYVFPPFDALTHVVIRASSAFIIQEFMVRHCLWKMSATPGHAWCMHQTRLVRWPLCHKVNLPSCVARRPLCHKVNLPCCVAAVVPQSKSTEM